MSPSLKRKAGLAAGYFGGLVLGVVVLGAGVGVWIVTGALWAIAVSVAAAVGLMVLAMVVGVAWMRTIDEAAREAHKSAWFWGGSAGLAVGGIPIMLAAVPQAAELDLPSLMTDRTDPAAYMATGAVALMILMLVGYGVVWAWWWLWRGR